MVLPLKWLLGSCGRQHREKCAITPLHETIRFGVVRCRPGFLNGQQLADLCVNFGLIIASLVEVELLRWREPKEELIRQFLCHGSSLLVPDGVGLSPSGEIICYHEDVAVASI